MISGALYSAVRARETAFAYQRNGEVQPIVSNIHQFLAFSVDNEGVQFEYSREFYRISAVSLNGIKETRAKNASN